jgi:hypothetical protein
MVSQSLDQDSIWNVEPSDFMEEIQVSSQPLDHLEIYLDHQIEPSGRTLSGPHKT